MEPREMSSLQFPPSGKDEKPFSLYILIGFSEIKITKHENENYKRETFSWMRDVMGIIGGPGIGK